MQRREFDVYVQRFSARDYGVFNDYYIPDFELHVSSTVVLKGLDEVQRFYKFLHHHIQERILVDRFVSDQHTIALEVRVQITGIRELTAEAIAAAGYTSLHPIAVGQTIDIPQFIHYHIGAEKFEAVICALR